MRGFGKGERGKRMSGILRGMGEWDGEMPEYNSDYNYAVDSGGFDQGGMPEYQSPVLTATPSIYPEQQQYYGDLPTVFDAPGTSTYNAIQYTKPPTDSININPADVGKIVSYAGQLFRVAQAVTQQGQPPRYVAQPLGGNQMSPAMMGALALAAFLLLK